MMLRRTPFRRPDPPPSRARVKEWDGPRPTARATVISLLFPSRAIVAAPKENVIQSQAYMATVRTLACRRCWTSAKPREFCHTDEGKGTGIKTDCRLGWPGCGDCHYFVGSTGHMSKEGRREFERFASMSTRAEVEARGLWPKRLPRWEA